jgi:hypothetical protein
LNFLIFSKFNLNFTRNSKYDSVGEFPNF